MEETHVTDPARLKKLLALLALAFCWAVIVSEWLTAQKPRKLKKLGRLFARDRSLICRQKGNN